MGIFDLIGTTGSGWLSDRFDNRILLFAYYGLRGLSLLYLPFGFISEGHGLSIFAVFYGLDWIATVPPTVGVGSAGIRSRKHGPGFRLDHGVASDRRGPGSHRCRAHPDNEGSYDHAFIIAGSLCLVTAIGVLFAGRWQQNRTCASTGLI